MSNMVLRKQLVHKSWRVQSIALAFCLVWFGNAYAEGSWWQRGKELLESFGTDKKHNELTLGEISGGLKDALWVGTENVVSRLGKVDGFNADSVVHIPLPDKLKTVKSALGQVGMSYPLDELELKLNRAAETATPRAKELFRQAITEMTLDDVMSIYQGPEDAATRYFESKMSPVLEKEMRPIIENCLVEVGAIQAYDRVVGQYQSLPFIPDVKTDLTNYAVARSMDGIFYYLAKEEAAIRKDPVKRTTDLLKRVFGPR